MAPPRILCVDDDPGQLQLLRNFLAGRGFEVVEEGTADGALRAARRSTPDAMVLDYALPDGDALAIWPPVAGG